MDLKHVLGEGEIEEEELPKSDYKPPVVIPKESYGDGCNSKVYYVCNDGELFDCSKHFPLSTFTFRLNT